MDGEEWLLATRKQKANSFILPEKLVTLLYHAQHYDEIAV